MFSFFPGSIGASILTIRRSVCFVFVISRLNLLIRFRTFTSKMDNNLLATAGINNLAFVLVAYLYRYRRRTA